MTEPTSPPQPTTAAPLLDIPAILAALQDQIDDLRATVEAQQATIERLLAAVRGSS
jgi:hypothetical protein